MKAPDFIYHRPGSVAEAVDILAQFGDDVKVIAGGQSLLPIMNMRLAEPAHLVDITAIRELRYSTEDVSGARYGAATTHMMLEDELVPDVTRGLLRTAASGIGYRAIRTRGTVAGSLAHSDSSAEWPTVLSALNAGVHARSVRGDRTIPVRQLLRGFFTTALEPDELITEVEVARLPTDIYWGLYKKARKAGEFAESLAVVLRARESVELWLGAARDVPVRLTGTEQTVGRRMANDVSIAELSERVAIDIGADTASASPVERHALQVHAVSVHRAMRAAEQVAAHV